MINLLKELFAKYNISATDKMLEQLNKFYELVIQENKKFNLTAITEKNDFATKHILDCSLANTTLPQNAKVIDVGAGAGFPSIPLKIIRPDINLVMLDSLNKRVNFLNMVVGELNLENAVAVHARAEDYALQNREKFDIAIARAVAGLSTLSEYCLPFVRIGGQFVALKGSAYKEELEQAQNAIKILGGELKDVQTPNIPEIDGERAIVIINKKSVASNKYPRGKNQPRLKPL